MTLKLTEEQRTALQTHAPGSPVLVRDEQSQQVYWLVAPEDVPSLWADYLDNAVSIGVSAIERGEVVEWDSEAMKDLARAAATRSTTAR